MDYNYLGKSLEECLEQAEKDLSIAKSEINYDIIKEEKGFLKKKCEIIIHVLDENIAGLTRDEENVTEVEKKDVTIEEDSIVVHTDESFELEFQEEVKVYVNDEEISSLQKITSKDNIKFQCEKINGLRELNVTISTTKMEARISIHYVPEYIISISCTRIGGRVKLLQKRTAGELPPLYSKGEIKELLKEKGIVFGFLEDELNEISKKTEVIDEIVAEGISVINDEDDILEIKFENTKRNVDGESSERIDYRNLYAIASVSKGEVIAELITGKIGTNGKNIFGEEIKKNSKNILKFQAKDGCIIDANKVIANTEGRPTVKNGIFYVNKIFEINHDVDMKSGNISFIGDVKIAGSVKDGMLVEAGNGIEIGGNVENAKVIAQGEVHIKGNCLNANILVGAKDFLVQSYLNQLNELKERLENITSYYEDIVKKNLLGADRSVGEIIKVLLETKFKDMQRITMMILVNSESVTENGEKIKRILRSKFIGLGPLSIKHSSELYELINYVEIEIKPLLDKLMIPVDVYLNYCQDTTIKSTGDIIITGKGLYISNLCANGNIEFQVPGAIARGGSLRADKYIKAKTVGSVAGVTTTLKVSKQGIITADIAYQNSIFIFDQRQYLLEIASKNIRAYIDEKGEVIVDKFVL